MKYQNIDFPGTTQNPKFRTGETEFRLTSSSTNGRAGWWCSKRSTRTAGNVIYHAVGILETEQETIIATRNGCGCSDRCFTNNK